MPKDGYVCAPTLGPGIARPVMPWHHRAALTGGEAGARKVEFDSGRAVALLTVMFCGTPSAGAGKVLGEPDFGRAGIRAFEYAGARSLSTAPTHEEI